MSDFSAPRSPPQLSGMKQFLAPLTPTSAVAILVALIGGTAAILAATIAHTGLALVGFYLLTFFFIGGWLWMEHWRGCH